MMFDKNNHRLKIGDYILYDYIGDNSIHRLEKICGIDKNKAVIYFDSKACSRFPSLWTYISYEEAVIWKMMQ
jgi:hypothetical protein